MIMAVNSWAVEVVRMRSSAAFLRWTKSKLEESDRKTKIIMVQFGALRQRGNVLRLYTIRNVGGSSLVAIEGCAASED